MTANEMPDMVLRIDAGENTEEILQAVLSELGDEELQEVQIDREYEKAIGYAAEPITVAAAIVAGTALFFTVVRLVEKKMESDQQAREMKVVLEAYRHSSDAGEGLSKIAEKHINMRREFGNIKPGEVMGWAKDIAAMNQP